MQRIIIGLLVSFFLSPAFSASAPLKYQIELIIFSRDQTTTLARQVPLSSLKIPSNAVHIKLNTTSNAAPTEHAHDAPATIPPAVMDYTQLLPSAFSLTPEEKKIARASNLHPLLHLAWQQPLTSKKQTVLINSQDELGQAEVVTPQAPMIEGTLAIRLNQARAYTQLLFLYLPVQEHQEAFELKEDRVVKLNQLNYFDHPHFGVLLKISSIKNEEPLKEISQPTENKTL